MMLRSADLIADKREVSPSLMINNSDQANQENYVAQGTNRYIRAGTILSRSIAENMKRPIRTAAFTSLACRYKKSGSSGTGRAPLNR